MEELTPEDLKTLIEETKKGKHNNDGEKRALIAELNKNGEFDSTDIEYMWGCSVEELEQLLKEKKERKE